MEWISLSGFLLVCCASRGAAEGLTVSGAREPLVARSGDDVILTCSVDPPVPLEELQLEWMQANTSTLMHMFAEGEDRPEAQHKRYRNRTELFHEGLAKGNYSLKLNNVTSQDKGGYRCMVYSGSQSGEALAELREVERLFVTGTDIAVCAYAGEDVILNCTVDTHAPLEELEVQWMKVDPDILVHIFADGEDRPESQHQRFQDRTELFHSELAKGNFSLKLKSLRTEDKGKFKCIAHTNTESAEAFAELKAMGIPSLHIGTMVTCALAVGVAVITAVPVILRFQDITRRHTAYICFFLNCLIPPIAMFISFILWGVTEGFTGGVGVFAALRLLPILHQLLKIYDYSTLPVKYHYAVIFCGTTILAVVNSITLISGVALQAGKDCRAVIDIQPFVLTADFLYLISLLSSIIAEVYFQYKKKKEETEAQNQTRIPEAQPLSVPNASSSTAEVGNKEAEDAV